MSIKDLLPIGSVVMLKEGKKRIMISGVKQTDPNTDTEYDYTGVIYPEGHIGEIGQILFNHSDIVEIYFEGYRDEEREDFINRLESFYNNQ